jgi:hypothetical protein
MATSIISATYISGITAIAVRLASATQPPVITRTITFVRLAIQAAAQSGTIPFSGSTATYTAIIGPRRPASVVVQTTERRGANTGITSIGSGRSLGASLTQLRAGRTLGHANGGTGIKFIGSGGHRIVTRIARVAGIGALMISAISHIRFRSVGKIKFALASATHAVIHGIHTTSGMMLGATVGI